MKVELLQLAVFQGAGPLMGFRAMLHRSKEKSLP